MIDRYAKLSDFKTKKLCRTKSFSGVCLNSDALVGKKFGQKSWHREIEPVWRRKAKIKTRNI